MAQRSHHARPWLQRQRPTLTEQRRRSERDRRSAWPEALGGSPALASSRQGDRRRLPPCRATHGPRLALLDARARRTATVSAGAQLASGGDDTRMRHRMPVAPGPLPSIELASTELVLITRSRPRRAPAASPTSSVRLSHNPFERVPCREPSVHLHLLAHLREQPSSARGRHEAPTPGRPTAGPLVFHGE